MAKTKRNKKQQTKQPKEKQNIGDFFNTIMYGSNKQKSTKAKVQKAETVQDLLSYDEITPKGVVIADGSFFALLEVSQLNSHLLDFQESSTVWLHFSTMLNSINVRHTYLLQNLFYDVNDFVNDYEQQSLALTNLTPQLIEAREDVLHYYRDFSEERNLDQRAFMIFRFNPKREGIEMGLTTGNAKIDEIFSRMKSNQANTNEEENRNLAFSMLDEVCDLAYQLLHTIGCPSVRLNRDGVLDYIYGLVNRDISVQQRLSDARRYGAFNTTKHSDTPNIILDVIESIKSTDELYQQYYEANHILYEDDEMALESFMEENTQEEYYENPLQSINILNPYHPNNDLPVQEEVRNDTFKVPMTETVVTQKATPVVEKPVIPTTQKEVEVNTEITISSHTTVEEENVNERSEKPTTVRGVANVENIKDEKIIEFHDESPQVLSAKEKQRLRRQRSKQRKRLATQEQDIKSNA